jgi:glycosyltransferase involved in cell wall biosynthesis
MLEAYASIHPYHPDVTLVIGGKRQWKTTEIDEAFDRLNLGNAVHFTGYVDDEDLPALYSAASLFLFPTLYEGFGLPPLEAMACGTPVVTSNLSSQPEATGDAAILVNPYNIDEIAVAIRRVFEDNTLAEQLRQKGLKRVEDLTYEREAKETMSVYQEILG